MQAALFLPKEIWQFNHFEFGNNKQELPSLINALYLAAFSFNLTMLWLYVKQYTKVAVMIPLIFSTKTPQIVNKFRIYPKVFLTVDLTVYTFFISLFLVQLISL